MKNKETNKNSILSIRNKKQNSSVTHNGIKKMLKIDKPILKNEKNEKSDELINNDMINYNICDKQESKEEIITNEEKL